MHYTLCMTGFFLHKVGEMKFTDRKYGELKFTDRIKVEELEFTDRK